MAYQPVEDLLALRRLEVDGDVLRAGLRAVGAQAVEVAAHGVALQGLDANDACSQLVVERRGERSCDDGRKIKHGVSGERMRWKLHGRAVGGAPHCGGCLQHAQRLLGVLSERWGRPLHAAGRLVQAHEYAHLPHRADRGVIHVDHVAVVDDLRMVHALLGGQEGLGGHVRSLIDEYVHPLVCGLLQGLVQHHGAKLLALLRHERGRACEARVVEDVAEAHNHQRLAEEAHDDVGHLDPLAVPGPDGLVANAGLAVGIGLRIVLEAVRELDHHLPHQPVVDVEGAYALHQAGFHVLPDARLLTHDERGHDAPDGCHGGAVVGDLHGGVVRAGAL